MKADTIVAAYYFPTLGALPSFFFSAKELFDTILLDVFKVFNHTHSEKGFVAFVDVTESFAWEILAFITVLYLSAQEQMTSLFKKGTLFVSGSTTGAVRHSDSLALYLMGKSKVAATYSAIHSTRSN